MELAKLQRLKELVDLLQDGVGKKDFDSFKKEVLEGIVKGQGLLTQKIEGTQSKKDAEADEVIRQIREAGNNLLAEMKGEGAITFTSMKNRALEAMNALFDRMRLQEKFDQLVSDFQDKVDELDIKVRKIPSPREIADMVRIPPHPPVTAEKVEGLEEFIKKLIPERVLAGGGGTSAMGVQYALGRIVQTVTPTGDVDGVNLAYTVPSDIHAIFSFHINGEQIPSSAYTVAGRTITFGTALPSEYSVGAFEITYV